MSVPVARPYCRAESERGNIDMYATAALDFENDVKSVFRNVVSCFSGDGTTIQIQGEVNGNLRVVHYSALASVPPSDQTRMGLHLRLDIRELWIVSLHVGVSFRSTGLWRQLVNAAEEIARTAGTPIVNVFPLVSARSFWLKMGYRSLGCNSRVLAKNISEE